MIRSFNNISPKIHDTVYVDEQATVIGNVEIGKDSAMWPHSVARGDINTIHIGQRTNVQDGSILHVTHAGEFCPSGFPLTIGNDVTIGHCAVIHACTVNDRSLIGMGSVVMDGAVIEDDCIIGAGSLVTEGTVVPSHSLALGSPARVKRSLNEKELAWIKESANNYIRHAKHYMID